MAANGFGAPDLLQKTMRDWNVWETQLAVALEQDGVEKKQVFREIAILCLDLSSEEADKFPSTQFPSLYQTIQKNRSTG